MKKKILYSIGSLGVASVSSIVVLSCGESSNSDNTVEIDTEIPLSNVNNLEKQKNLVEFFKQNVANNLKIDADVEISGETEWNQEIKKALKSQYQLSDEELSYIKVESPFSSFRVGNYKKIKLSVKVGNEAKSQVDLKVGQFAKMIDLTIDLEDLKNKAKKARQLNITNGSIKQDTGYLEVPVMEEDKNIIAVLVNVNGDYTSDDFVQYSNFKEYEAAKKNYSIDHNSTNQNEENKKKKDRMLYNKSIKTPVLVSVRKSEYKVSINKNGEKYEPLSTSDSQKIKNSFDYLRLAANLSTREILLNVWKAIEDFAFSNINAKASGFLTEIKRITNLENTIRNSDYENIPSYKTLSEAQKTSFKNIIDKMINPLIDQLSNENLASIKRFINELGKVPSYIQEKHNQIVENLNSLNDQTKKFKIHNLKFYKAWKNSGWTLNIPKYDDSEKVRYSRYLLDIVSEVPKIFDTSHAQYINPIAYAIGDTFKEIIRNNFFNMPLAKAMLDNSYSLYSFEKFINDLFNRLKNTKLLKTKSLDDPNISYDGTIINYIKKLFTNFFIFNEKFIENLDSFNNKDENNKEWYNLDLDDIIDSYLPNAWDWIKTWEETTNQTSSKLMKAIKDDLTNNANSKPLSMIKLSIINGETNLYDKKINLIPFFNKLPKSLFTSYVDRWKKTDDIEKIKLNYKDLIDQEIDKTKLLNTSIQDFWNDYLKVEISKIEDGIKSISIFKNLITGGFAWTLFTNAMNADGVLDFVIKQTKPILEDFLPILQDFGNTLFKVIQGEGGIYGGIDVHYLSSLVLRLEWLYNKYYTLTYLGYPISDYLPDFRDKFKPLNKEILKYSKWLEPINLAFAPIRD